MNKFLTRKIINPILAFLKQGVSPSKLAFAISLGIVVATIPVFGATTLVCFVVIWIFRLNPGVVLLVNQFAYPLQFLFYIPLIIAGEWLFNAPPIPLSITLIFSLFSEDVLHAISILWWSTVFALTAWFLLAIPFVCLFYYCFRTLLLKVRPDSQR